MITLGPQLRAVLALVLRVLLVLELLALELLALELLALELLVLELLVIVVEEVLLLLPLRPVLVEVEDQRQRPAHR